MHALLAQVLAVAEGVVPLSSDFTKNTPLQSITLYLFFAGTVAMEIRGNTIVQTAIQSRPPT